MLNTLATNSLKVSDYDILLNRLKIVLSHSKDLKNIYGSRNHARKRFRRNQLKQKFYDEIVKRIAPDPNTIIAMGSAKFATTTQSATRSALV